MLDKLVVHLKNIIFFKVIVYILLLLILSLLIPVFKDDLNISLIKKQKSNIYLQDISQKLDSINDFKDKIFEINKYYNSLVNDNKDPGCAERIKFINNIKLLSSKYNLFEPISIRSSRDFAGDTSLTSSNGLEISYFLVEIRLRALDNFQLLALIYDLCNLMPKGSVILNSSIRTIEGLSPMIIDKLNTATSPNFIETQITILLRNVIYKY